MQPMLKGVAQHFNFLWSHPRNFFRHFDGIKFLRFEAIAIPVAIIPRSGSASGCGCGSAIGLATGTEKKFNI